MESPTAGPGHPVPSHIFVSSMPLRDLISDDPCRCHLVCSARALGLRLHVLYDPDPSVSLSRIPASVVAYDLFQAVPALELMMQPGREQSCVVAMELYLPLPLQRQLSCCCQLYWHFVHCLYFYHGRVFARR